MIKYLQNGKKVQVMQNISKTEFIVQEIMVSGDKEFPSGTNMIASNLLDSPVLSWQEKKIIEAEKTYKEKTEYYEKKLDETKIEYENQLCIFEEYIKSMKNVLNKKEYQVFKRAAKIISGKMKFVVYGYQDEITTMEKFISSDYNMSDGFKLLTMFGKDDGNFSFKLSWCRDGSGGNDNISLFETENEAIKYLSDKINSGKNYSDLDVYNAKKYGIKLDGVKLNAYYENQLKTLRLMSDQEQKKKEELDGRISMLLSEIDNMNE